MISWLLVPVEMLGREATAQKITMRVQHQEHVTFFRIAQMLWLLWLDLHAVIVQTDTIISITHAKSQVGITHCPSCDYKPEYRVLAN